MDEHLTFSLLSFFPDQYVTIRCPACLISKSEWRRNTLEEAVLDENRANSSAGFFKGRGVRTLRAIRGLIILH